MHRIILVLLTFTLLTACSPFKFAVVNAPAYSYDGEIKQNVSYGPLAEQKLDIYIPKSEAKSLPVVVFFHGGRWTFGDKSQYKFVGMTLSNLGYVVVIPDTRLFPKIKFPTFVEDAAKSLAWVHKNIADYSGNQTLFLAGHSSGAHMAALIVADSAYLQAFALSPNIISAFAGMSGPYDFEPDSPELIDIFSPPSNFPKMVVTNFIGGDEPPMLLIYTREDETVHPLNLKKLEAGITRANGQVETIIYDHGGHAAPVAAFSWVNPADLPAAQDIDRFFKSHQ